MVYLNFQKMCIFTCCTQSRKSQQNPSTKKRKFIPNKLFQNDLNQSRHAQPIVWNGVLG